MFDREWCTSVIDSVLGQVPGAPLPGDPAVHFMAWGHMHVAWALRDCLTAEEALAGRELVAAGDSLAEAELRLGWASEALRYAGQTFGENECAALLDSVRANRDQLKVRVLSRTVERGYLDAPASVTIASFLERFVTK